MKVDDINLAISKHPKTSSEVIKYGTAGFRTKLVYIHDIHKSFFKYKIQKIIGFIFID